MSGGERFLLEAHRRRPGRTGEALGAGRLDDGRSSIRWLLDSLPDDLSGSRCLDLGCGDGGLSAALVERGAAVIGVDPSPEELALARGRGLPTARFVPGRAEDLPLPDASVDHALAHLVLNLLDDAEGARDELHRVLRPRGWLHAVLGAQVLADDGWSRFAALARPRILQELPSGDPRLRDPAGVLALLGPAFGSVQVEERTLRLDAAPQMLWGRLEASYLGGALPTAELGEVRRRWFADVAGIANRGVVPAALLLLRVSARRA